jgi:hypothetical protein
MRLKKLAVLVEMYEDKPPLGTPKNITRYADSLVG